MITKDDLLKEISIEGLTQLSDLGGNGEIDEEVINDAIEKSVSFVESFIVTPDSPTPLLLKITAELAIFELKRKNELFFGEDNNRKKEIEGYLSKMSKGSMPTTVQESKIDAKRDRSYAFKISPRRLQKR